VALAAKKAEEDVAAAKEADEKKKREQDILANETKIREETARKKASYFYPDP